MCIPKVQFRSVVNVQKLITLVVLATTSAAFADAVSNSISPIPEPSSLGLLGAGSLAGTGTMRRKFNR
jgi:PEP-CTERM motif